MADTPTEFKTLDDSYQEIIEGACAITVEEGRAVETVFDSSAPTSTRRGHTTNVGPYTDAVISYGGGLKVYMRRHPKYKAQDIKTTIAVTGV